ncbi:NAD(P)-binding protein [Xylariaceae sp. FL0594]|nr:NAD(P)-binding protein [Xylariaceae sp. FL0594]
MTTENTVYVVTGGNRGIGLGLVKTLLARPSSTVIATVRSEAAHRVLEEGVSAVTSGPGSSLHVVHLDFTSAVSPHTVLTAIQSTGVADRVDVLINNAGGPYPMVAALETEAQHMRQAFETNTIAPLLVFQGLWPLMRRSGVRKLAMISSSLASIGQMHVDMLPAGAYGPSRCAQNWLCRALHLENHEANGLIVLALHPGWVQTRAGQLVADDWHYAPGPPVTVEQSVEGLLRVIDGATKETSGKFLSWQGKDVAW